jgi:signal transduction histidine kinase/tetratricopeptide (TPR) repeat protein
MLKVNLLSVFLLFSFGLTAQKVEMVELRLDSLSSYKSKVDFLNQWSKKNYIKHSKEAYYYSNLSEQIAIHNSYASGLADCYMQYGRIYHHKEKYKNALGFYNKSISTYSLINDSLNLHKVLVNRGRTFCAIDKYSLALKDYMSSLSYFERNNDNLIRAIIYNNIGIVYKHLKNYQKALKYYSKAETIYKDQKLTSSLYHTNTNIANIYSIQKNFQEALSYHKKNLDVLKQNPNKYRLAQTYHNIGACFLEMEQYTMAMDYQKQSLKLKEEIGNKNLIITSLNGLSHANYMLSNYEEALKFSKRAYQLGRKIGNIELQKNSAKEIFKIYAHTSSPDSAIFYFDIHEQLRDSILTKESLKQVAEIQAKYEAEKKEAQIALLEKENKNKAVQRNGLIVILILIGGYAGFIIYSYYSNKKLTRLLSMQKTRIEWSKEILDQRNQELHIANQTKNKLFQIISHDLRSPLASVSGISHLIQILLKQGRYQELDETSQDLNECVTRVLNLTDNLLSWSLNQSGRLPFTPVIIPVKKLLAGIIDIYKTAAKQKNILLEFSIDQDLLVYADRPMLETVIRNLLNNALKFTPEGGLIILGAEMANDHTEIWIEDNGIGIPQESISNIFELDASNSGTRGEKGNGLGLILCKDFIKRNQGKIWVESKENIGTTFRFTVPNAEKIYSEKTISNQ